jgi:hypothetical protein
MSTAASPNTDLKSSRGRGDIFKVKAIVHGGMLTHAVVEVLARLEDSIGELTAHPGSGDPPGI